MNQNPWFVERMVAYDQERVQQDMRQIRLEEEAMKVARQAEVKTTKAPAQRPRLLTQVFLTTIRWLVSALH